MRSVFQIFRRDLRRLLRNPAAALVMAGVCLLPSFYAWFNIAANMDPYSNTQGIKVAVANNDTGADTKMLSLNAGDEIIKKLKDNDQLGWTFVDTKDAKEGVKSGEYYAAIVIPKDFSESLVSVLSGKLEQPELDYYINEKKNAIAPKITDTGASTIQQQINDTFSAVASESISDAIRSSVTNLEGDIDSTNQELTSSISSVQNNLSQYQTAAQNFQNTVKQSNSVIDDTIAALDQVDKTAQTSSNALCNVSAQLSNSRTALGTLSGQISQNLSSGETQLNTISVAASTKLGIFETNANDVLTTVGNGIDSATQLNQKNTQIINDLYALHQSIQNDSSLSNAITEQIQKLQTQNASLQELLDSLNSSNSAMKEAVSTAKTTRTSLEQIASNGKSSLQKSRDKLNAQVFPQINQSLDGLSTVNGDLTAALSGIPSTTKQVKQVLTQLKTTMNDSADMLSQAGKTLDSVNEKLGTISTDLKSLQSSYAYQKLLSLEGIDADAVADFMSSPVSIQSDVQYDVKNYGSGMTPFYTNLALWVGGLILVSILKQEVDTDGLRRRFTPTQGYFGRWLLFIVSGLIQGVIVCAGDLVLLKVQCVHPIAFVFAGMVCSFVYVNIIYALAATFKHIGKAVAVVLIILQIPGSSGTYPIEMMPEFFQKLHPLFPFTYGINAMRECIAGYYGNLYVKNLLFLSIFVALSLFIGLVLRPLLQNLNHLFDRRLDTTELMLCETATAEYQRPTMRMLIRTLARDEVAKQRYLDRSVKFERNYSKRIKYGFLCMLIIPLVFLILMFSLDSKLVFLVLWIVSLIALSVYLIVVEYIHDKIQRQIDLNGLTSDELMQAIKENKSR
ncbi:YhgE/Pip family protein [Butyricicoccus intestinisimiae]|jgi:putative membrane protein|uniref:YhgE/Pip family protein n=1 Tax=Butyricicoccus intestinisimiae TaxID=2841509 RepID=UPI003D8CFE19